MKAAHAPARQCPALLTDLYQLTMACGYEPGRLLAGCYPGDRSAVAAHVKLLESIECGVLRVINLMEEHEVDHEGERFATYEPVLERLALQAGRAVECWRFPIEDLGVPGIAGMAEILDWVDRALAGENPDYLHCSGGRGRTGTVVAGMHAHAPFADQGPHFRLMDERLRDLPEREIESSGYVIHTLVASVWCLLTSSSFEETVLKAVNLGGDTDTTGTVAGGLAGALYGEAAIPREWTAALARREEIGALFGRFRPALSKHGATDAR